MLVTPDEAFDIFQSDLFLFLIYFSSQDVTPENFQALLQGEKTSFL